MAKYVDGFVLVVPKEKTQEYIKMAEGGRDLWMKHGALAYYECRGDDLKPQEMDGKKTLAFPQLAKASETEFVWFSFIVYASKEHRDEVNKKVMDEMAQNTEQYKDMVMPFDMQRMAYGGFMAEVEAEK